MATATTKSGNAVDTKTTWTLDPAHSMAEFSGKHMMITTVKSYFAKFDATLDLDVDNIVGSSVTASIDVATLSTGIEFRDNHLRSADFLDVEHYPTITFTSKRVERVSDD